MAQKLEYRTVTFKFLGVNPVAIADDGTLLNTEVHLASFLQNMNDKEGWTVVSISGGIEKGQGIVILSRDYKEWN